jgi:hypothetical protein
MTEQAIDGPMVTGRLDSSLPESRERVASQLGAPMPTGPIYIVGLDRSGKTTMRAFVASHSRIAIPAVGSNMWTFFYGRFGRLDRPDNFDACLDAMYRYKHVRFMEPDLERIRRDFYRGPTTYARLFALFLMQFAEREGKPRWGAQSGLTEQYADELFAGYEGLKIIHMVRDPRDRYEASLAKWPNGRGRAGGATARWRFSIRLAERNLERFRGDYLIVRFEDLIVATNETVRGVCSFLGEEYESQMMAMGEADQLRRSLQRSGIPEEPHGLLSSEFVGRYRDRVSEPELRFIQLHARRLMLRHGYTPEQINRSMGTSLRFSVMEWPKQMAWMLAWSAAEGAHRRWPRRFGHSPGARMIVKSQVEATR